MKNRKGFTTVELVIVIAVIAVLATVLTSTFSGLIGKANGSKALQEAKNALTNYLIENSGTAPEYMLYDASGKWVALKRGAPTGVYTSREDAIAALRLSKDKFTDSGDEKLWVYDEGASSFMHISFDDVANCFKNLKNKSYDSLFDEPFFGWLRTLHNEYGAKFSLYAYYSDLRGVPSTYAAEFADASD